MEAAQTTQEGQAPRRGVGRPKKLNATPCGIRDCEDPVRAKGLCERHYRRMISGRGLVDRYEPPRLKDPVSLTTRVERELRDGLVLEAQKKGLSAYTLTAQILEEWMGRHRA